VELKIQTPIQSVESVCEYEIGPQDDPENKTLMMMGKVVCDWSDRERQLATYVLGQYLTGSNDAPLKKTILSAGLAVFNLFPIPPLDGSKVLFAVLPDRWYDKLMRYERYGMILMAVLLLTNVLDVPLVFLREKLLDLLVLLTKPFYTLIANFLI